VRVIAATHRDLEAAVELGSFGKTSTMAVGAVLEVPALRARRRTSAARRALPLGCNREEQLAVDGFTRQALACSSRLLRETFASSKGRAPGHDRPTSRGGCGRRM